MGGVLHHVIVSFAAALIIHWIHFKWEFSLATFLGNLLPDVLKVLPVMAWYGTASIAETGGTPIRKVLYSWGHASLNWFSIGFFFLALLLFLYHYHIIKKKKFEEYAELWGFVLLGIILHMLTDAVVDEAGIWW